MSQKTHNLDANNCIEYAFDPEKEGLKILNAVGLQSADGVVNDATGTNAVVVAALDVSRNSVINIYAKTIDTLVSAVVLTLQVSVDGVNYANSTITLTPSLVAGTTVISTGGGVAAKYARVIAAGPLASGKVVNVTLAAK